MNTTNQTKTPTFPKPKEGTFPFAFPDYVASQKFLREEWIPDLTTGIIYNTAGKPVNTWKSREGYLLTSTSFEGMPTAVSIHRAIIIAACSGRTIPRTKTVNHINSIKTDNRIQNLELLTLAENVQKYFLREPPEYGIPTKSLTREGVLRIRRECAGLKRNEHARIVQNFAKEFGVSENTVRNAEKGITYPNIGEESP